MAKARYRLCVLSANPVPYHVAFYRALTQSPSIDLTVCYCSDFGASGKGIDPESGIDLNWGAELYAGYRHLTLRNIAWKKIPGTFWSLINPGIVPHLFRQRYDAVIIPGYANLSFLLGFFGAWMSLTPIFLRGETYLKPKARGLLPWGKRLFVRFLLKTTRACLAIGGRSEQFYKANRVPANRIFLSPYSVDNRFFSEETRRLRPQAGQIRTELGLAPNLPLILFCGKLAQRKRPQDLLEAFFRMRAPAALCFVGEGALRRPLESAAKERNFSGRVVFAGFVPADQVARYYAAADLFVLPSQREVSPLVINEAMACSLPVIVADAVPSAVDFVSPEINGLIFPLGNIPTLTQCLDRLAGDPSLRSRMGEASWGKIQGWSLELAVEGVLKALNALDKKGPTS